MSKLYCYVDETGQDPTSEFFIVVAVVSDQDQDSLRKKLIEIEYLAKTGQRKWHKSRPERRLKYLELVLNKKVGSGEVYFGRFKKPIPYFFPVLEILEKAILSKAVQGYQAMIFIDGIDKFKAAQVTNALRLHKIRLEMVRSRRDESEPPIRLADMWAGCIRAALKEKREAEKLLYKRAKEINYLFEVTKSDQ